MKRKMSAMMLLILCMATAPNMRAAVSNNYKQTNLVGNLNGVANHTDAQLSNPWGIAFSQGLPFWISDNNSGFSTFYDQNGVKQGTVTIPSAANNPCTPGCPTGSVANFNGNSFVFDSEDGIIAAWNGAASAAVVADRSASGAVYKGLAILTNGSGTFLLAANFNSGKIDVFDGNFQLTTALGTNAFVDPNLPAGFAPHSVHVVNNTVYVAYGMQNAAKHDPMIGAGLGVVDAFDITGKLVKQFAMGGTLNAPWGVVRAPATFGAFANDLLIGNFGDGRINAFDPNTGQFLGQVEDSSMTPITNPGLWELVFGADGTGDPNTLYLTAGGSDQTHGLFASVVPASAVNGPDFSLNVSSPSVTITAAQAGSVSVRAAAAGGLNRPISLACSGLPQGVTCTFSSASITPGSSNAMSTVTFAVTTAGHSLYGRTSPLKPGVTTLAFWLPFFGTGFLGLIYAGPGRRKLKLRAGFWAAGLLLVIVSALVAVGCGGGGSSSTMHGSSAATVMITGTAGTVSHSTAVSLTVN